MRESPPKDAAGRLRQARTQAGFNSARSAAIRFGWKPSTYGSHENGQTPVPQDAATIYAKAFKTSVAWLLTGEKPGNDIVQIDGAVLRHGEVEMFRTRHAAWIWLPFGIIPGTIVLQVRDAGMAPRYEVGDIILIDENNPDVGAEATPDIVDDEALVQVGSQLWFKRLRGTKQPDRYDLEGINCQPIKAAEVTRAFRAIATIRAQSISELPPGKARAAKRARR
jgi:hypothetical protein